MTEEEADYFDELFTKTTPKVSGNGKGGFFARNKDKPLMFENRDGSITIAPAKQTNETITITLDGLVSKYIQAKMLATKQSPSKIISNLVKKELATT